jgi:hypothetical protein
MSTPIPVTELFTQFLPLISLVLVMFIVIAIIKQLKGAL